MAEPFYMYSVRRAQGSRMRIAVNDVPIADGHAAKYVCTQEVINELVVPGENVVSFEIARAPWERGALWFAVAKDGDWGSPLLELTWGAEGTTTAEEAILPRAFSHRFVADDTSFEPVFRRARPASFGCDGVPEQRELVRRMQRAVEWKQTDEMLELLALQHDELWRANHRISGDHPSTQRPVIESFFAKKTRTRPLDPAELHFESRAGGRVAYVTRADGSAPVEAIAEEPDELGFTLRMAPDVRMTMVDGAWRLF